MFFFPFYRILVLTHTFANANSKTELSPQPIRDLLHSCKRFIGAFNMVHTLCYLIPQLYEIFKEDNEITKSIQIQKSGPTILR